MTDLSADYQEAVLYYRFGRLSDAERCCRQVLKIDGADAAALHLLGLIALRVGRGDAAAAFMVGAICSEPGFVDGWSNLGIALSEAGRLESALCVYAAARRLRPDYAQVHANLGNAARMLGRLDIAATACRTALVLQPDYAQAYCNLAAALTRSGQLAAAIAAAITAIRIKPDYIEAHVNLGSARQQLGQGDAAAASKTALCLRPDHAKAYSNLGAALEDQGLSAAAQAACRTALRLEPGMADAHANLGAIWLGGGCHDHAGSCYVTAICLDPERAEDYANLGGVHAAAGRLDAAIIANRRGLYIRPDLAKAHYNLAYPLLLRGELSAGWEKYEWRWQDVAKSLRPRSFDQPRWQGDALGGRTILLHAEQGMGDAIQFSRYVPMVSARGGRVLLEVPRPLVALLGGLAGVDRILARGNELPVFDVHCPLLSLPGLFDTRLKTIPAPVPYLSAEPARIAAWRERIASAPFRVGIAWAGSPAYRSDRSRSVPLSCFAPLARIAGVLLISLQKRHGLDQLADLPDGMDVASLGEDFDEGDCAFLDSAAVMTQLDLVITVDSAIGHLAGALGVPVWLILSEMPHWPWLLDRDDTPWYPHTRLFRQKKDEEGWEPLFERMAMAMRELRRLPSRQNH